MREITLPDFEARLKLHNWNYKKIQCASVWNDGHVEQKRLTEISFQSPEHRRMFLDYKKMKEVVK